jgi:hypothetical protein
MPDPFTVIVCLSKGDVLGETMIRLRTWLDAAKIQPATFRTEADGKGYTFAVGFCDISEADRFRAQFCAPC